MLHGSIRPHAGHGPLWLLVGLLAALLAGCIAPPSGPNATVPPPMTPTPLTPTAGATDPLPAGAALAFVRDDVLTIQLTPPQGAVVPVEDCRERGCRILFPVWSPDRNRLLYTVGSFDGSTPPQLRVADRTGRTQTVAETLSFTRPADWSPAGDSIVYLAATERTRPAGDGPLVRVLEVITVPVAEDGALGEPVVRGEVGFAEGCGGGGRSPAAVRYESEGGFAYGYLAGIVRWAAGDLLLYSNSCTSIGVGRFDLASGAELEPLPGTLRSLALNAARDGFAAIDAEGFLVRGAPGDTELAVVPTAAPPDLVFVGQLTGTIYYTTIETTEVVDLTEALVQLDPSLPIMPIFDRTRAALYAVDPATGAETVVVESGSDPAAYAYARVQESFGGRLILSRVGQDDALRTALEQGTLTAETLPRLLPTVDLLWLPALDAPPLPLLEDAAQATLALPTK